MPTRLSDNEKVGFGVLAAALRWHVNPWVGGAALADDVSVKYKMDDVIMEDFVCAWSDAMAITSPRKVVPDGYFCVPPRWCLVAGWSPKLAHFCVVEVEHSSKMNEKKRRVYGVWWDIFDDTESWQMHLITVNQYYRQHAELDLREFFRQYAVFDES